jgi:hypothetical protein
MHNHHGVHVHRDRAFLIESVIEYFEEGLQRGEAGVVIARAELREALAARFGSQLVALDAERTLARFMRDGMPQWQPFHAAVGGMIANLRLRHPAVRAYGEMVDVLWQRGQRDAAIKLEEFWNDLAQLQTFSLLCAYDLDSLEEAAPGGGLERICRVHTHFIPARDHSRTDQAVARATEEVLERPLAALVDSVGKQPYAAAMPAAYATLLWLGRNMPQAAEQVLGRLKA